MRVFSAADDLDLKGTIDDFEWWAEDEDGKKLKNPMYLAVVEDDDGERWPIGVASLPEMVLAADDQPANVRLESDEADHDMGEKEIAESDQIAAAMEDATEEESGDESSEDESAAAPAASVTSPSKTPAVRGGPRRSSRSGTAGAHVRQTRDDYSARPPDKKKARFTQQQSVGTSAAAGRGSSVSATKGKAKAKKK